MNDTNATKAYVNGTRREYKAAGHFRYRPVTHRSGCPYARYLRNAQPDDHPSTDLPACCR